MALIISNSSKTLREFGPRRGGILLKRVRALVDANTLEDVRYLPGHFHELIGDRKGQWACDLDQPYRLIFVPHEQPIPQNADGKYLWIEIKGAELTGITNYHGK